MQEHDDINPDSNDAPVFEAEKVQELAADEVFGIITEDGPNYRAVCRSDLIGGKPLTMYAGGMARHLWTHDEDANRSGCPFNSCCL